MIDYRAAVVAEARSWIRTPYHHMGRIKGAGADCLSLLAEVYERAGVVPHVEIPYYPPDWHLHRDLERYLMGLADYGRPTDTPLPGDIAMFKYGRCFAHGGIVSAWPALIHADMHLRMVLEGDANAGDLFGRQVRFFDVISVSAPA